MWILVSEGVGYHNHVVVLGIIHTYIALRYKPAFTATQWSVGLARRRPWFDPRPGQKVISIFSPGTF